MMIRPEERPRLRAKGNLSYLDFIRLVKKMWMDGHPDIPIVPTADKSFPKYPIIAYRLDLRKTHPSEPKPRHREEIPTAPGETALLISGQRFQNIITFTVMEETDKGGPHSAEAIIELFEDFMLEFTPVFKELGASEFVYSRRLPDGHDTRPGAGTVSRSVSYLLTTEKIIKTSVPKLEEIVVDARLWLTTDAEYFDSTATDEATPTSTIVVYGRTFSIGDWVKITGRTGIPLPNGLVAGFYIIDNIIMDDDSRQYTLSQLDKNSATPAYIPVTTIGPGSGSIVFVPDYEVYSSIHDQMATPNH